MIVAINDLRVNNILASGEVRITDPYPTISWKYSPITRITASVPPGAEAGTTVAAQSSFEIRIADNASSLGTNSFTGNSTEVIVSSTSDAWRFRGSNLNRGETYFGQIQVTDEFSNVSGWYVFSFRYNALPVVSGASISPSAPSAQDDLILSYTFSDADGDLESGSLIWWFRNGVHERQFDGLTRILSENLNYSETWMSQIIACDGYEQGNSATTSAVTVTTVTPTVADLLIEPSNPTTLNPLFAKYDFSSTTGHDNSVIRWYINGNLVAGANSKFERFNFNSGDTVHFEVQPNDGISSGSFVASSTVTIVDPPYQVVDLRVQSQSEPLDVHSLTPTLSWGLIGPQTVPTRQFVRLGTAPYTSNVASYELASSLSNFSIPSGTLDSGTDYYASVAVASDDPSFDASSTDNYTTVHFRTEGSRWSGAVSNATGWTVETIFSLANGLSGIEYGNAADYHGIRIYDGTYSAEIRFFIDKVDIISTTTISVPADFTTSSIITIIGQGTKLQLYQNYKLLLDATGLFTALTTQSAIEFGSLHGNMDGYYQNLYYTTDGAYVPNVSLKYTDIQFTPFYHTDGEIDAMSSSAGSLYFADSLTGESSEVFKVSDNNSPVIATAVSRAFLSVSRIVNVGKNTYLCHNQGATALRNYPIAAYNSAVDFVSGDDPTDKNWKLIANTVAAATYGVSGLTIDTTGYDGSYYFAQDQHGTPWFEAVNNKGWTVDFSLSVGPIVDENSAQNSNRPDGCGIYVNDGVFYENIIFFTTQIVFVTSGTKIDYNTTQATDYLLTGQGNGLSLYANGVLIGTSNLSALATAEGNGGRPVVFEENNGNLHSVWHDDGSGFRQLYYSKGTPVTDVETTTSWTLPKCISSVPFGSSNADIAVDSHGTVYVIFEMEQSDHTDIGIVVQNAYGWSEPYLLSGDIKPSLNPRIAIDSSDNVHVVWEDARTGLPQVFYASRTYTTGLWSSPTQLTTNPYGCMRPSIDVFGTSLFVSYTQEASNGLTQIYLTGNTSGSWISPVVVYSGGRDSDFSDIAASATTVYVTWHDSGTGNYEIYARRYSYTLVAAEAVQQITSDSEASRFPSIGLCDGVGTGANNVYIVWEDGGDMSPYSLLGSYTATLPNIRSAYYDSGLSQWRSSNLSGHNVVFSAPDNRASRRPRIQKRFSTNAHIVYESEPASLEDEYIATTDAFSVIDDAVYDLSNPTTYSLSTLTDLRLSGRRLRKEIRFGDFSQTLGGKYTFGHFNFYLGDAVAPYEAALISNVTTSIVNNAVADAVVNPNGDAWLANAEGLIFFFRENQEIARLATNTFNGSVNCVTADLNHVFFVGTDTSLYVSYDHIAFLILTLPTSVVGPFRSLSVDGFNNLWVGTDTGLFLLGTNVLVTGASTVSVAKTFSTLPVTRVVIDPLNIAWAATSSGLISVNGSTVSVFTTSNSGIPSNAVNDIAIRNSAIRYVATSAGVAKMSSAFEKVIVQNPDWTNNTISVAWQQPNILWVSAGVNVFELLVDDEVGSYTPLEFRPYDYALVQPSECDNPRIYRFSGFNADQLMEVYINGRKQHDGFIFSSEESAVVFDTPLFPTDRVEVAVRNDIQPFGTLVQNEAEVLANGNLLRKITKLTSNGSTLFAGATGDEEQFLAYETTDNFTLPYDKIGLDQTPPTGGLTLVRQITRTEVELTITADDNLSGVDSMIVSVFPNFTTDGSTPQSYVPYSSDYIEDLGFDLGLTSDQVSFSDTAGQRLVVFNGVTYAGTASPARIYQQNAVSNVWSSAVTLDAGEPEASVEFMCVYKNSLVIGTGVAGGIGKIFVTSDGTNFTLLSAISGTHARCAAELNNILYIGTSGSGLLYAYNGSGLATMRTANTDSAPLIQMGSSIYSIWGANGNLYCGTGEQARLFQFNPITLNSLIIYIAPGTTATAETQITAISSLLVPHVAAAGIIADPNQPSQDFVLFAGTAVFGRIVKSINGNPFITSFAGLPAKVTAAHIFNNDLWVSVGKTIYKWDDSWVAKYSHPEEIEDFLIGPDVTVGTSDVARNDITAISSVRITKMLGQVDTKTIYLSLKDVAGNINNSISLDLAVDQLENFINTDRILELNEYGQTVFTYDGTSPFYAANRVVVEQGIYLSEIFNGTNDHVSWDQIYWDADVPDGTDLTISVRAANSRSAVTLGAFTKTFTADQFAGVDLSNLSGQYIQFQVNLSTTIRGKTPKLFKIVIQSRTRTSVHFFTTNFSLPSQLTGGLLTAQTFLPVAADVVFGLNTNNSSDFSDYQIIQPNQVFTTNPDQQGMNMRIGVKLISPLPLSDITDTLLEYDAYNDVIYNNVVDFTYTNSTGTSNVYNFTIEFYNDEELTDLQTTLYTLSDPTPWSSDGLPFTNGGITIAAGETVSILAAAKGIAAVRCGVEYYLKIFVYDGSNTTLFAENIGFEANCHPNFINTIFFDFINSGSTDVFNFRVKVFADATRTKLLKTFYSGLDVTGWFINGMPMVSPGATVTNSTMIAVDFTPDLSNLDATQTYYLVIDEIGTSGDFALISTAYTMRINPSVDFGCSEYVNVPVVKDIGIMFELADYKDSFGNTNRTVLLNL